jgi:hypothetical protein
MFLRYFWESRTLGASAARVCPGRPGQAPFMHNTGRYLFTRWSGGELTCMRTEFFALKFLSWSFSFLIFVQMVNVYYPSERFWYRSERLQEMMRQFEDMSSKERVMYIHSIYIYIHIHIHICMYTYTYIYYHTYIYISYAHTHTHTHTHNSIHVLEKTLYSGLL